MAIGGKSALMLAAAAVVLAIPTAGNGGGRTASATLSVSVTPAGSGSVRSGLVPGRKGFAHVACPGSCTTDYPVGATAGVIAKPAPGFRLARWTGACAGQTTTTCRFKVSGAASTEAVFEPTEYTLTLVANGAGFVTFPGGPVCSSVCAVKVPAGSRITLSQWPGHGYRFLFWDGACAGAAPCGVTMDAPKTATGYFRLRKVRLHIDVVGNGRVLGAPPVTCESGDPNCTYEYDFGTRVDLDAVRGSGVDFLGWSQYCTNTVTRCVVVMDGDHSVTARFG